MNYSRKTLLGCADKIDLYQQLQAWLEETPARIPTVNLYPALFKCRVIYASEIEKVELIPYTLPNIRSLKIVVDDQVEYSHKYLNRERLDTLFNKKGDCDDVLIVKNGLVTDTTYANILFYDGNYWLTPAHPLLRGTQREKLLSRGIVAKADIRPGDLALFEKARLINAMIRFEDKLDVEVAEIKA